MFGEAAVLPCQIAFAPVVVEAGFADGDDFGVAGVCREFVRAEFFRFRVVGVDADAGVDVRVLFGDGQNLAEALPADADGEGVRNVVGGHVGEYFGQAAGQAVEVEVAVRVYQLHVCGFCKG